MAAVPPDDAAQFPFWRRNAALLAAGNGLQTLVFSTAYPFLPLVVQELGVRRNPESWVGIIVGTLFTLSFLLQPVWGGVADHFGHRILVLRAGLGMGIGTYSWRSARPWAGSWAPCSSWHCAMGTLKR